MAVADVYTNLSKTRKKVEKEKVVYEKKPKTETQFFLKSDLKERKNAERFTN